MPKAAPGSRGHAFPAPPRLRVETSCRRLSVTRCPPQKGNTLVTGRFSTPMWQEGNCWGHVRCARAAVERGRAGTGLRTDEQQVAVPGDLTPGRFPAADLGLDASRTPGDRRVRTREEELGASIPLPCPRTSGFPSLRQTPRQHLGHEAAGSMTST